MHAIETAKAHKKRIDAVIDYIQKNINNNDISLKALAEVANYSPFHLQKLFKQIVGESPKQYIIKIRLETALLLMIIHPHKPIKQIAVDCGFSSPAVFSRSVKNYFGISPEEIRASTPRERMRIFKGKTLSAMHPTGIDAGDDISKLDIKIKKTEAIKGIYLTVPCNDMAKIQQSFREVIQIAITNDLFFGLPQVCGIFNPHQGNIYKTFVAINKHQQIPNKFNAEEIKAGKYVTFKIKGDIMETLKAVHFLYHQWLPENGYKIADIIRFEMFSENPAIVLYQELNREVYLLIEPI
jgi:AraC family transcriptional regulator